MKTIKLLAILSLFTLSLCSSAQNAITITAPNPAVMGVNQWPNGNSWNMTTALYNDVVNINAATVNVSNANTFTATQTFNGINVTTIGATSATAGIIVNGQRATIISDSALTKVTLTAAQSGATVLLKALAGDTIVLPAATTANLGVHFVVLIAYSATSVGHCVLTTGNDVFYGTSFVSSVTTPFTNPYLSTTNKTMLMSTTTTGGLAGGRLEFTCIAGGRWNVSALLYATGTIGTPFK